MDAELNALEEKTKRLINLCQAMQRENQELRQQLAGALAEKKQLAEKMGAARTRLETLLTRIPENQS
jgi:cell division protein ZapB